jgi:HEPN domain-containing protein
LRASSSDEESLVFPLPDAAFGFHAQQAVEKLYKVLIVLRTGTHPFVHDLISLRKTVEKTGLAIPIFSFPMDRLVDYAGDARYDEPIPLSEIERQELRGCIRALREFVLAQVSP